MSLYGILWNLGACGWAENRHFCRKVLRFLFELSCPQIALCRATQKFVGPTSSEEQTWKSFDKTSSIAHWREKQYLPGLPTAEAPSASEFALSSPCSPPSLCHSEHSNTQPSLMLALPASAGGRSCPS